jgi:hypothetical protein
VSTRVKTVLTVLFAVGVTGASVGAAQGTPRSYVLRGTVRDSATGRRVPDAQIWPILTSWGVVSDSGGRYELRWPYRSVHAFLVRLCGGPDLARVTVDFWRDSIINRDISITPSPRCPVDTRPPWAVDARDTTSFRGHYISSWEGGGWLEACTGERFHPDWGSPLGSALRKRNRRNRSEGRRSFVRFRGRIGDDRNYAFGPIFLVVAIEEVRDPRADDCP